MTRYPGVKTGEGMSEALFITNVQATNRIDKNHYLVWIETDNGRTIRARARTMDDGGILQFQDQHGNNIDFNWTVKALKNKATDIRL